MNSAEEIYQQIAKKANMDESKINPSDKLMEDLGFDSMDIVELVMDIEHRFQIVITDNEMDSFNTVNDIVRMTDKYLNLKIS